MANTGEKGMYKGFGVEVTKVHDDGALDLQKIWPGSGEKENLPWYERVAPGEFTRDGGPATVDPADDFGEEFGTEPLQPEGVIRDLSGAGPGKFELDGIVEGGSSVVHTGDSVELKRSDTFQDPPTDNEPPATGPHERAEYGGTEPPADDDEIPPAGV